MTLRDKLCHIADYKGQQKAIPALQHLFEPYFTTLTIDPHFDDYSSIDLYMYGTLPNNTQIKYAIECKDRNMEHTAYAEEGYIIEDFKKEKLLKAAEEGYRPIYLNTFTDDYMVVWDLNKVDFTQCGETGEKTYHRTNVMKESDPTYKKNKTTLKNSQAQWIGRMK